MKAKLKIIHAYPGTNDNNNLYVPDETIEDDYVYLSPVSYKKIFGKKRSIDCNRCKRLAVVKIESPITGKSIYRQYCGMNLPQKPECATISQKSLRLLSDGDYKSVLANNVTLTKGSRFLYYWNHPFHATRISTKLGILSVGLSTISIIITLITLLL